MNIRDLLIVATGDGDDATAIAIGADLARRHGAAAVVVNAYEQVPLLASSALESGAFADPALLAVLERRADDVRRQVSSLVAKESELRSPGPHADRTGSIAIAPQGPTVWQALARELALTDLVVIAQSLVINEDHWTGPLGEALMDARAPVYVARDAAAVADRPAAVAWDGSFEASRAVRAAIPLLREASDVFILQNHTDLVVSPGARADPSRLTAFLERRGVHVTHVVQAKGRRVGRALLAAAEEARAGLLVAGAYGHSRLRELLFGGSTRDLLRARSGPHLLVAH